MPASGRQAETIGYAGNPIVRADSRTESDQMMTTIREGPYSSARRRLGNRNTDFSAFRRQWRIPKLSLTGDKDDAKPYVPKDFEDWRAIPWTALQRGNTRNFDQGPRLASGGLSGGIRVARYT
jgi:hypothetical protein